MYGGISWYTFMESVIIGLLYAWNAGGESIMRFAICDDEQQHINILTDYFATHKDYHIETEAFESGEALLEAYQIQGSRFDALFIDMEMGGMNGIETANAIREIDERVSIVFVTSHEEYAIDCFQCSPLRFLKKPLQPEKMNEALRAIEQQLSKKTCSSSSKFWQRTVSSLWGWYYLLGKP